MFMCCIVLLSSFSQLLFKNCFIFWLGGWSTLSIQVQSVVIQEFCQDIDLYKENFLITSL